MRVCMYPQPSHSFDKKVPVNTFPSVTAIYSFYPFPEIKAIFPSATLDHALLLC